MGVFERKVKRNQERLAFKQFTDEWARAKRNGQKINGRDLGKKPSFSEFRRRLKAYEEMQREEAELKADQMVQEEKNIDLEWKEQ